jgi:hypothetical protein
MGKKAAQGLGAPQPGGLSPSSSRPQAAKRRKGRAGNAGRGRRSTASRAEAAVHPPSDNQGALWGLWHREPSPSNSPLVLYVADGYLSAWSPCATHDRETMCVNYKLGEREGQQLILDSAEEHRCWAYRVSGDSLELSIGPGHQDQEWDLTGRWRRIERW